MTTLLHIADRVLGCPLLIAPQKAQMICEVLAGRIGLGAIPPDPGPEASRFEGDPYQRDAAGRPMGVNPYRTSNGVGIVSVVGTLVNRGAWVGANSGVVSYEGVAFQVRSAAADPGIHSIILDLQSPGGEAVGAFELADMIREVAKTKPVTAVVNGLAASAAYAIASGATEIVTTPTGVSGSIGVVLLHADMSKKLENDGIRPTLIFAGDHKVDGNPFEPLPEAVRDDLQLQVDGFYKSFLSTVAKGRGSRLTEAGARRTGARTFVGQAAVDVGLADRVGTFDAVLKSLSKRAPGARSTPPVPKGPRMENPEGAPVASNTGFSQADLDRVRGEGVTAGKAAGAAEERNRIAAITGADGVKGNGPRLSAALALAASSPTMPAEAIVAYVKEHVAADSPAPAAPGASAPPQAPAAGANPPAPPAQQPAAALDGRGNVPDSLGQMGLSTPSVPGGNAGPSMVDNMRKVIAHTTGKAS